MSEKMQDIPSSRASTSTIRDGAAKPIMPSAISSNSSHPQPSPHNAEENKPSFTPPDGGRQAWLTVAGGWLCQFCSFGFVNALGSFQYIYETDILKHDSQSNISWILTVQLFLMFLLSQPVGLAVDMFGIRPVLAVGTVFSVGGLIALSFATTYWQIFLAQALCFGLGAACIFVPGLVAAGQFFKKKRAFALGIVASGSSVGGVVFPIMLAKLFDSIGFRQTLRWTALMVGVMLLGANLLTTTASAPKGLAGRRAIMSIATFRKPPYVLYSIGAFFVFWGLFGPFNYLPTFSDRRPETSAVALYTVSIVNAASIPGRIVPNYLSDKIGSIRCMAISGLGASLCVVLIWLPINYHTSLPGVIIFAILFGFTSGAFVSLMTPALIEVAGGHTDDLGVMLGTFFAIISIAGLTGLPLQSAIAKEELALGSQNLQNLIIFCGITMMIGSVFIGLSLILVRRRK